jgi:hypothetical protein
MALRVFSGVFQAVKEFLEVRQPEKLVFASNEDLGHLFETYLEKQGTSLHGLGYKMQEPVKASPLAEFTMVKTTPSAWKN